MSQLGYNVKINQKQYYQSIEQPTPFVTRIFVNSNLFIDVYCHGCSQFKRLACEWLVLSWHLSRNVFSSQYYTRTHIKK